MGLGSPFGPLRFEYMISQLSIEAWDTKSRPPLANPMKYNQNAGISFGPRGPYGSDAPAGPMGPIGPVENATAI